jgi:DNA-binding MarR family transcriptional regulator
LDKKLSAYIRYLRLELDLNDQHELDAIQIRVLNEIFCSLAEGKKIRVGDILERREIASQATIHAALKKLVAKKLIAHRTITETRAKYIEITPLALERYKELAK